MSNEELLSILLRTGTNNVSVKELSMALLKEIDIYDLENINYKTLSKIKGIGEVKAITLLSALELGKRLLNKKTNLQKIKTGDDVFNLVKGKMANELQEKFLVLYLDTKNNLIMQKVLFIGTVNHSFITARDVFREAVKNNAAKMILVHNHPAGSVIPSYDDISLTNTFIKLGKMMEINVLDHIIIGNDSYYSIREGNRDLFN